MNTTPSTGFVTSCQTAQWLQVTLPTVRDYLRRGWIQGQKIGKAWRIEAASVERLLRCGPPAR